MTKTTNKRRTAASIIRNIQARLWEAQEQLKADELNAAKSRDRVADIQAILDEAEKEGGPDNA